MRNLFDRAFVEPLERLNEQFSHILPALVTVMLVLIVGGAFAFLLRLLTQKLLHVLKFDRAMSQTTLGSIIRRSGVFRSPSDFAARVLQGFVWLFIILVALTALDTDMTRDLGTRFVNYVPDIVTALLVLLLGSIVSKFLARSALLAAVNAQWPAARIVSGGVRVLVMSLAVLVALEQLRIGRTALMITFGILFAGVIIAAAIAFGLGGKDVARQWLEARTRPRTEDEDVGVRHL
jgi:hypothetical protein